MSLRRLLAVLFISFLACGSWAQQSPTTQAPASVAQDSLPAEYDANKPVVLLGAVTNVAWNDPHPWIYMDVKKSDVVLENWAIEVGSTETLLRLGFTKNSLAPGAIIKVTGFRAKDGALRVSGQDITFPDGRLSAQTSAQDSANGPVGPRLFAIRRDGTGLKELSGAYRNITGPIRFSPDGSKVLFTMGFNLLPPPGGCGGIAGVVSAFNSVKMFLMDSDGTADREVFLHLSATSPFFSSDGKKILFTAFDDSTATCYGLGKLLGIYSANLDGTDVKPVMPDASGGILSHDGTKLVFSKSGISYVSNSDGSAATAIGNYGNFGTPVFNPADSSEIMLVNMSAATIFAVNLNTFHRRIILQAPEERWRGLLTGIEGADYSPDGKTVVYSARIIDHGTSPSNDHQGYLKRTELYEVTTVNGMVRQITNNVFHDTPADPDNPNGYTHVSSPLYAPDGKTIVFLAAHPRTSPLFPSPSTLPSQLEKPDAGR